MSGWRRGFEAAQFSAGTLSILSIFKISTAPRCDSSLKPNCSRTAETMSDPGSAGSLFVATNGR